MKKVTVKKLIEFRWKNKWAKIIFVENLRKEKRSQIMVREKRLLDKLFKCHRNALRFDNDNLLDEQVELLQDKS